MAHSSMNIITVPNGVNSNFVPYSAERKVLWMSQTQGLDMRISFRSIADAGNGRQLNGSTTDVYLNERDHGELVKGPWFIRNFGAPGLAVWFESF